MNIGREKQSIRILIRFYRKIYRWLGRAASEANVLRPFPTKTALSGLAIMVIGGPFCLQAVAKSNSIFAPKGCEFSLIFPSNPLIKVAPAPPPRKAFSAELSVDFIRVQALCTTGYPAGLLGGLDDADVRNFSEALIARVGVRDARLRLIHAGSTRTVDILGTIDHHGSREIIRAQVWYGDTSRLMVQVLAPQENTALEYIDKFLDDLHISHR